jgi:hypothetical protein
MSHPFVNSYRLYIDESGDHTYNNLENPAHKYLGLLGVWFRRPDHYVSFASDLERFKEKLFGKRPDNPVILRRSEIINKKGPFGMLKDPNKCNLFDAELLEIVGRANFKMVCLILNKETHKAQYVDPFHPYHYCVATMLERYCGWMEYKNSVGDVVAESRGKEEDLQLKQAYRNTYESGTRFFSHERFQKTLTSHDIKIRPKSANIAGLQLADILARPVKCALLAKMGMVQDSGGTYGTKMFAVAEPKFNRNEWRGTVEGYGYKCL